MCLLLTSEACVSDGHGSLSIMRDNKPVTQGDRGLACDTGGSWRGSGDHSTTSRLYGLLTSDSHYHLVSFYHPNDVPHDMMMANEEFNDRTDWSLQDICRRKW